jgi:ribonuclease E
MVEVMVGKRTLGEGRGHNKKEAEQAAARDALEKVEKLRRKVRDDDDRAVEPVRERPASGRGSERSASARAAESEPRREPAPERSRRAAEPPAPAREPEEQDEEGDSDAPRRRRSRRGGRSRHARGEDAPRGARAESDSSVSEPPGTRGGERERSHRGEPYARSEDDAPAVGVTETASMRLVEPVHQLEPDDPSTSSIADDDIEEPRTSGVVETGYSSRLALPEDPVAMPPRASVAPAAPRPVAFGRGRRRDASAATGAAPTPSAEPASEPLVDPYVSTNPPDEPSPDPIVDVAAESGAPETEHEREARIDEMERALDNFGRRRSPDYGRRGRRR